MRSRLPEYADRLRRRRGLYRMAGNAKKVAGKEPRPKRTREHNIAVKLNDTEYDKLLLICRQSGLNISDLIRSMILGSPIRERPPRDLRSLLRAMERIENTLFMILRNVNEKNSVTDEEIGQAFNMLYEIYETFKKGGVGEDAGNEDILPQQGSR